MHKLTIADLHILLVEPSDTQSKIIAKFLEESDVNAVDIVKSVTQAKHELAKHPADVVVSAMYLSDGTGLDILEHIKNDETMASTPFMLVSSETSTQKLEAFKQSGVSAILPKPFELVHLERALNVSLQQLDDDELELHSFDAEDVRVLLVDDSRLARNHIKQTLNNMGIRTIVEAENGAHALTALKSQEFDIVVTDYNMPEMDGRELSEYIRFNPSTSHIPIIMITSENQSGSHLANIQQTGVNALCDKPFSSKEVRAMMIKLLEH